MLHGVVGSGIAETVAQSVLAMPEGILRSAAAMAAQMQAAVRTDETIEVRAELLDRMRRPVQTIPVRIALDLTSLQVLDVHAGGGGESGGGGGRPSAANRAAESAWRLSRETRLALNGWRNTFLPQMRLLALRRTEALTRGAAKALAGFLRQRRFGDDRKDLETATNLLRWVAARARAAYRFLGPVSAAAP